MKNGPTRAQLQKRVARLEAECARLKDQLQHGDRLRKVGEHWYALTDYFDPHQIVRTPVEGAFLMGMLQDTIVIEVPDTTGPELRRFSDELRKHGIMSEVLFIHRGVRFLRLATVDEEMERRLDAVEVRKDEAAEEPEGAGADPADAAGGGPEPAGDGLGDSLPADGEDPGGGGDSGEGVGGPAPAVG